MKVQTLVITKEGWKEVYRACSVRNSKEFGLPIVTLTDDVLERVWGKIKFRNGGASSEVHPIKEDEFRYDRTSYGFTIGEVKTLLDEKGLTYRDDGFEQEYISV